MSFLRSRTFNEDPSRFRDETRSKGSPKNLVTPDGNEQLRSSCPNSEAPQNSFIPGLTLRVLLLRLISEVLL